MVAACGAGCHPARDPEGTPDYRRACRLSIGTQLTKLPHTQPRRLVLFAFVQLLGEVVFEAHFADGVKLALQVIDVFFFLTEDLLE